MTRGVALPQTSGNLFLLRLLHFLMQLSITPYIYILKKFIEIVFQKFVNRINSRLYNFLQNFYIKLLAQPRCNFHRNWNFVWPTRRDLSFKRIHISLGISYSLGSAKPLHMYFRRLLVGTLHCFVHYHSNNCSNWEEMRIIKEQKLDNP